MSLWNEVISDALYAGIIGGFGLLVWAFFTKKKPMDVLKDLKESLFGGDE
jgi:hypothetical protein